MRMLRDMLEIATWIAALCLKICGRRFLNYTTGENLTRTNYVAVLFSKSAVRTDSINFPEAKYEAE